jgi:dihydropteroate synthase
MDEALPLRLNPRILQDSPFCISAAAVGLTEAEVSTLLRAFEGLGQTVPTSWSGELRNAPPGLRITVSAHPTGWGKACGAAGEIGAALQEALQNVRQMEHLLRYRGGILPLGGKTLIMGVLNVTPDSFYDGGSVGSVDEAVEKGVRMAEQGAAVIDVGGESTRPGSDPVPADEELRRVLPVIRKLRNRGMTVSVDTSKAAVASEALEAGAHWVNDVSALADPRMGRVVAEAGAALVLMHAQGTPKSMQQNPRYDDIIDEITRFLRERSLRAVREGVSRDSILIDPGIGFGKRVEDNFVILRRLDEFRSLGFPLLVGPSRKSFIGAALDGRPASGRLYGTLGAVAACALNGAHMVRVHDVAEAADACRLADRIAGR